MRKRIGLISEHASPLTVIGGVDSGGQNVYVVELARHLARRGHHVDVFTRRDDPSLPDVVEWLDGVRVIPVPAGPAEYVRKEEMLPLMGEFAKGMINFIEREPLTASGVKGYDLIHANFWMSGIVASELKRRFDLPFVITFHALGRVRRLHQGSQDGFPEERLAIEQRLMSEADAIIAECPQDEQDLIQLYGADPERICTIPAGFNPAEFHPVDKENARRLLGLDPEERLVAQIGRMVPRKGVETVIRGIARLGRDHGVAARLLIVGGDSDLPDARVTPEIGRLLKIARDEGIEDRVTFVGRRSREMLKYYYSAVDIFATLPWYEPFGMTPLEAMGCGTLVVGSAVGGLKSTIVHGETGYLVPPQDPDAFAAQCADIFRHPKEIRRLGLNGLKWATGQFTWDRIVDRMDDLYEEIIRGEFNGNRRVDRRAIRTAIPRHAVL